MAPHIGDFQDVRDSITQLVVMVKVTCSCGEFFYCEIIDDKLTLGEADYLVHKAFNSHQRTAPK